MAKEYTLADALNDRSICLALWQLNGCTVGGQADQAMRQVEEQMHSSHWRTYTLRSLVAAVARESNGWWTVDASKLRGMPTQPGAIKISSGAR